MVWVRAERSSEAEKNIKRSERRHNDNDGETFDSCAVRLESWHWRAQVQHNATPLAVLSRAAQIQGPRQSTKGVCWKGMEPTCLSFGLKSQTRKLHCPMLGIKR